MNRLADTINRVFKRNGHALPTDFSQSNPIAMPEKRRNGDHPTDYFVSTRPIGANPGAALVIGKEHAEVANEFTLGGPLGMLNDMPVLSTHGLQVVDLMMTDSAVGTYIELKKIATLSTPWSWEAAGDEPAQVEHAAYLTEAFDQLDSGEQDSDGTNVGVRNKLRDMLSAIEYGYSLTNVVLSILETGEFKGKLGIADLKTKPPHNFTFDVDTFLNLKPDGIIYTGELGIAYKRLPADAFILYSYRATFGNPYGYSDCIRAYDRWNSKRWRQKLWDIYLERHGCGTWTASEDPENPPSNAERAPVDSFLRGAQARSGIRHSGKITLTPHEPESGSSDMWTAAIDACNIDIARCVFIPDKVGFSAQAGSGGAYAMSQTHFDMLMMIIASLQGDLSAKMKQLGRKLVKASFGPQDKYPNFVFAPMSTDQKTWWLTSVLSALEKGALIPDQSVLKKVREVLELPEQENPEELPVLPGQVVPGGPQESRNEIDDPDDEDEEFDPDADPDDGMDDTLRAAGQHDRVIVVGGPRTGKTMLAVNSAYRHGRAHRHTDSLVGTMHWQEMSETVSHWFDDPGRWVVEGVTTARALRKWLLANPEKPIPAAIVLMERPRVKRKKGQRILGKGTMTVFNEIEPELIRRGATIIRGKKNKS